MNLYTLHPGDDIMGLAQDGNSILLPNKELLIAVEQSSGAGIIVTMYNCDCFFLLNISQDSLLFIQEPI